MRCKNEKGATTKARETVILFLLEERLVKKSIVRIENG